MVGRGCTHAHMHAYILKQESFQCSEEGAWALLGPWLGPAGARFGREVAREHPALGSRAARIARMGSSGGPVSGSKTPRQNSSFLWFFDIFPCDVLTFWPPRAPGWPETDSPRNMIANSRVDTQIRAPGTRFVAIFRF